MNSLKAIGAITHTLKSILDESISDESIDTLGVDVFTEPLDRLEKNIGETDNVLNLYLYMVKENGGWRNQDLTSRNTSGQRVTNPYLALDLFYVMSAHGHEKVNADLMLGYGMVAFHDNVIIGRDFIANKLASEAILADSNLSDQIEQIKITPEYLNTEEISKLWTMFGAKYRISAYYKVSVALLRKEKSVRQALPVLQSKLYVKPIKLPFIQDIVAQNRMASNYSSNRVFIEGDTLNITGNSLFAEITKVQFDGNLNIEVEVELDSKIVIPIPNTLYAGVHSIQIVHEMLLGEPEVLHKGVSSNLTAFVLSPVLENIDLVGLDLTADVHPEIEEGKRYSVFLNEIDFDTTTRQAKEYSFEEIAETNINDIVINMNGVETGTYLVRIRVNNATSPLFDDFSDPSIIIP
ncbi:uncharacterized protein DUF4255 [Mariniflexile fucanivorans]|uniref:Uncharacterized protein DUF4255 n=1 Tax=Mariniflexile fucanivorans TaxID=264023 RepID=A0A4R1RB12_9FLAO|nr:DUF4255 domain-containing protein [Mariniflexile fucanivorans]TCL62859.1 uncharacterized protein DUF4255 [Mariniflexile fucanivorans]